MLAHPKAPLSRQGAYEILRLYRAVVRQGANLRDLPKEVLLTFSVGTAEEGQESPIAF